MMKKNKLYTANKWNQPAFVDRGHHNIFDGFLDSKLSSQQMAGLKAFNISATPGLSPDILGGTKVTAPGIVPKIDWSNGVQSAAALGTSAGLVNGFSDVAKAANPLEQIASGTGGLKNFFSAKNFGAGTLGGAAIGAGAGLLGGLAKNALSGGLSSDAGNTIGSLGSTIGSGLSMVNPLAGAAVTFASNLVGGAVNRAFGSKLNQENIANVENKTSALNQQANTIAGSQTNEDVLNNWGNTDLSFNFGQSYIGEDGWFSSEAADKYNELKKKMDFAKNAAVHGLSTGIQNADTNQDNDVLYNYSAFGGSLNGNKKGNRMNRMTQMPIFMNNFALGGDIQMHGADFSTGLSHINAGGSHEENPNDGVQMGVDNEGTPNLVEEGETVWNDYVFSNRILADDATKQMFKLPKKKDVTFADISKKLEKEISERPNDPISKAGFEAQMQTLEEQQERQKSEMEAERARAAFEALSPEEQTAVMQNAAEQEAMAQQAAQEQAIAEQQAMQQPSPEEIAMMQQQQMMQQEPQMSQPQVIQACGGKINKYDNGGRLKQEIYKLLGVDTDPKFEEWAKSRGNREFMDRMLKLDWNKALEDSDLMQAIAEKNPALADALGRGYDFGDYKATGANGKSYDWNKFWEPTNEYSKQKGNHPTKYKIDKTYKGDVKELEGTDKYKAFTDYILNNASDEERMNYFKWIDDNTGRVNKYIEDGKLRADWKENYEGARTDGKYGIQHYTPEMVEKQRDAQAQNMLWNEETQGWDPIIGEVNPEYKSQGSFSWQTPDTDNTINYYKAPAAASAPAEKPEEPASQEEVANIAPKHRDEWMRYAGLFGPAVGLGMQMAGIGKPDYSRLDAAVANAGKVNLAGYKPIGDYLTYRPMDIWYEQNRMDANARATDRAIQNNAGPLGTKMAGLLASGYNNQIADGELYRKALEYNDAKRKDVAEFNRGTNKYNADAYNRNQEFNTSALNHGNQFQQNLAMQAAQERLNRDAGWYNGIYGNVAGLFKGIGDLGTENYRMNRISDMAADGVFGNLGDSYTGKKHVKSAAKGGKLTKKKKGLTF